MAYTWDNRKPTAQMLGRWQPNPVKYIKAYPILE